MIKDRALRRTLILAVLRGEISQGEAERRSGMAQGSMSRVVGAARSNPASALKEAEAELKFRRHVLEIVGKE
jgi:hypothetical protein